MKFRQVLIHSEDAEVHPKDRTRKLNKNLYAHYWADGLIKRKDIYWFDGKTVLLESSYFRYHLNRQWTMF